MTLIVAGTPMYGKMEFKIINGLLYLVNGGELIEIEDYDLYLKDISEVV